MYAVRHPANPIIEKRAGGVRGRFQIAVAPHPQRLLRDRLKGNRLRGSADNAFTHSYPYMVLTRQMSNDTMGYGERFLLMDFAQLQPLCVTC